jgi:hypothetical protein
LAADEGEIVPVMKKRRLLDEMHGTARGLARIGAVDKQTMRESRKRRDLFVELTAGFDALARASGEQADVAFALGCSAATRVGAKS